MTLANKDVAKALLTETQLSEIEARANAATPSPWVWRAPGYLINKYIDDKPLVLDVNDTKDGVWSSIENGNFIAHSRTDIPALIAMIREQGRLLVIAEEAFETMTCQCCGTDETAKEALRELREIRNQTEKG